MDHRIDTVVFDIGNVLLDWDPRHLYRRLIADDAERESFLASVCTPAWNLQQDLGRTWREATEILAADFPDKLALIRAFDECWEETVAGPIDGSVALLRELYKAGVPLYSITNFSAEKFPLVRRRYDFFECFRDIVVSGEEGVVKPGPEIFRRFLARSGCAAERCLFIDDSEMNVLGAEQAGMRGHHFRSPEMLADELVALGFAVGAPALAARQA